MRYNKLNALVLHVRPYRETSAMVQFFSREQGRLVGVMKGVRRGRNPVSLQPFSLGELNCTGKQSLMTVTGFDVGKRYTLAPGAVSAGFYLFELISRCLAQWQVEGRIFDATIEALTNLSKPRLTKEALAEELRRFEAIFLTELGYGLDYGYDAHHGRPVDAGKLYCWDPSDGFTPADAGGEVPSRTQQAGQAVMRIPGDILLQMALGNFDGPGVSRYAQALHQQAMAPLLGSQPLVSRTLYTGGLTEAKPLSGEIKANREICSG